ncbi:MAG: MFS transporter [Lachnospiraceae bacterium]|nr:MFS transporter [Lachnospiraceae bacterium]
MKKILKYNDFFHTMGEMKTYLLLWSTQSFSGLGSAMTSYALVIWSYTQKGSALMTAFLMVSSYAPYVLLSIFAGALSDKWNKKTTMLVCDTLAAVSTVVMLFLLQNNALRIWHLYLINGVNGVMNTVQQPASEVATTRVLPKKYYQRVGGLRYFASSLNSIMTPIIATAVLGIAGMNAIVAFDLFTFGVAFITLAFGIQIPEQEETGEESEKLLVAAKKGLAYLRRERGIFGLIMFLAAINLVASIYDAAFPAMMLSRNGGSERTLGLVNTVIGVTTFAGSILASFVKKPKSRVRVICNCLLFSMSTENFLLAFGRTPLIWCIGGFLGWIAIPLMSTNLDAIMRLHVPEEMQGRVYSVRNSLQFFTIPIGYFLGGFLVDQVFEPIMALQGEGSILTKLFGSGKGSGAAFLFFVIAFAGIGVCLYFRRNRDIWELENRAE